MPRVLTTNAIVTCPHGGQGRSIPSSDAWVVEGGTVLVEGDTGVIAGCALLTSPCTSYTLRSMGLNATTVHDKAVILVTDFQQSDQLFPLTLVETHDAYDDSVPAPVPAGAAAAPPLSPALADDAPPTVRALLPAAAFDHATQVPPTVAFTFALAAPFPLRWTLTYAGVAGAAQDVTSGGVPGPVVAPAGGDWSASALSIVVTLTTDYLMSLAPGLHHFYLTGVTRRGLAAGDESLLTVA